MPKIMIVEDDNNLREIYEARLQAEGYAVVSAKDGEEALSVAKTEKPDLIISDVMMPKISGFEMLDILRNTEGLKNIRIVMLTALGQIDDQQRAGKLGADRYLVKSQVTLEDIVKTAHELLQDTPETAATAAAPAPAPVATQPTVDASMSVATQPTTAAPAPTVPVQAPVTPVAAAAPTAPVSTMPSAQAEVSSQAQSTSAESANMNAGIEEFVAGAPDPGSQEVKQVQETPQAVAPAIQPVAPTVPVQAPVTPVAAAAPTAPVSTMPSAQADDAIMQNAVNSLDDPGSNTTDPASASPLAQVTTNHAAPVNSDDTNNSNVKVTHQKVITPLNSDSNKPDIQTLYQLEEAKEQAAAQPSTAAVISTPSSPTPVAAPIPIQPAPTPQNNQPPVDPNSIAL